MKTATTIWNLLASCISSALFIVLVAGNTAPQCGIIEPEAPICDSASDCEGLPHIMCEGEWACDVGYCQWDCSIDPDPDPKPEPENVCINNLECEEDQHCSVFDGVCDPAPGCVMGEMDCPLVCYGTCVDDKVEPEIECQDDSECDDGFVCEIIDCISPDCDDGEMCPLYCMPIGECVPDTIEGECNSDADCPAGELCIVECAQPLCLADDELCGEAVCFGFCQAVEPPPPPPDCVDDSDCPEGFVCSYPVTCWEAQAGDESGNGALPCDAAPEFVAGQCVPDTSEGCYNDGDCPAGYACDMGWCGTGPGVCVKLPEPAPDCLKDSDCGYGETCEISIVCEVYDTDGASDPAEKCYHFGVCVPEEEELYCWSDEECPADFYCQMDPDSYCLMGDEDAEPSFAPDAYCMGTCVFDDAP